MFKPALEINETMCVKRSGRPPGDPWRPALSDKVDMAELRTLPKIAVSGPVSQHPMPGTQ